MSDQMTLEQVERLATQLSPQEQLKLVAHIIGRLSIMLPAEPAYARKVRRCQRCY